MKKISILLLVITLVFVTGCGSSKSKENEVNNQEPDVLNSDSEKQINVTER